MSQNQEPIIIQLGKTKMFLSLLIAFGFVGIGVWLAFFEKTPSFNTNPFLIGVLGWITIIFFGIASIIILRKSLLPSQGLYIDSKGILDSSSGISAGFIPWKSIASIEEIMVVNQKFIAIHLHDPEAFIASQTSNFTRKAMNVNHKRFGSAVSISANNLKIEHKELLQLLQKKLEQNKHTQKLYQTN